MPTAALNVGIIQLRNAFIQYEKDGKRLVWLTILGYRSSSLSETIRIYTCMTKKQRRGKECFMEGNYLEKKRNILSLVSGDFSISRESYCRNKN